MSAAPSTASFRVSARDARIIQAIVSRAEGMERARRDRFAPARFDRLSASMDITACHANGNPLRLEELLGADDFNFAHDFYGIQAHLDRQSGELRDCFVPRFSA